MRAKILSIIILLSFSTVLLAQKSENGPKKQMRGQDRPMMMQHQGQMGPAAGMNLTDAQKEAFKQSMMAMHKQIQPLKNELGEAEARQRSLVTTEKPEFGAINKNLEKIGSIRVEMAKVETKHRLEMRAQLTDEQRLKFDMMKGRMGQEKGPKGMKEKMQMHRKRAM